MNKGQNQLLKDTTKAVDKLRQEERGHGSWNRLRSV